MTNRLPVRAVAAALFLASAANAAAADSVSTESAGGYGRIVFTLDPIAHVRPALAGGVLTLTFDRKVEFSPSSIAQGIPGYIASGRADADGQVYRFALSQDARLHTSVSADHIAVDLVPTSFSGNPPDLPPPPPKEVAAVDIAKLDVLKIHAGAYANYSRLVFDWPKNVQYTVFPGASRITIRFEAMARPDFTGLENVSPPWVKEAGWRVENRGTVIDFVTDAQSGYHDQRDGTKIVLDILAPKGDVAAYKPPSAASQDHPQTADAAQAAQQAKAIVAAAAQLSGAAPPVAAPATKPPEKPQSPAAPPAAPVTPSTPVDTAVAQRIRQGVMIVFPGGGSANVAAFVRGMTAWIVIDGAEKIDPAQLKRSLGDFPASFDEASGNGSTILRIGLKQAEQLSANANGSNLRVEISPRASEAPAAIGFVRDDSDSKHIALTTLIPGATHAVAQADPDIGDSLIVVPGTVGRGVLDARHYAQFAILPTAVGLVIKPYTDDLSAAVAGGHVTISRPGGLAMTASPAVTAQTPAGLVRGDESPSFLDFASWSHARGQSFLAKERGLRAIIAGQRSEDANHARIALARFFLANQFSAEALGLIEIIQANDPSLQGDVRLQTMRAAADYMMGRYRDAHNDIDSSNLDNDRHAALWRGLIEAKLDNWDGARKAFALADPTLHRYPPEWRARARLAEAEAALAGNAVETADAALSRLPHDLPNDLALEAELVRGRLYASEGRPADAHALFAALRNCGQERLAVEALYADTEAGLQDGSIPRDSAIDTLEHLRFRWRGDGLELRVLRSLGALYFEKKQWRNGLLTLRIASQNFLNDELARKAQDDMRATFVSLFLKGKAQSMSPIDALGLFYDFIDLTPIGPDGDEMIRRMADRLVAVDLLGSAESLLNYQVTKRLDGIARAQVAARLAMIDLIDHKPKDALATLRSTEIAGLPDDVNHARILLEARALAALKQWDQALDLIAVDEAPDTRHLRADIYWESGNWAVAAQKAEELVGERWNDAAPLKPDERDELMRAAIAYSLADDEPSLERLRMRFAPKMKASADASAFAVVTENIDYQGVAFRDLAGKIASVDTLERFMQDFKKHFDATGTLN